MSSNGDDEARQQRLRELAATLDPRVVEYVDDSVGDAVEDAMSEVRRRMDRLGIEHEKVVERIDRRLGRVVRKVGEIGVKLKTLRQKVGIKDRKSRGPAR